MNKEKEIEELNDELADFCEEIVNISCGDELACADCLARHLIEAGYRKTDEVRKETAREILYFLKGYITDGLLKNHEILNALIEHYGVEV